MDQLEMFRRQLRKKPGEEIVTDSPAVSEPVKVKKKRVKDQGYSSIRLREDVLRKGRLLSLWLEANMGRKGVSLVQLFKEALDCLIETKYPKFRMALKGFKGKE